MDIRRETVGIVQRAHAHEAHRLARAAVRALQGDAAMRATRDLLATSAVRGRGHHRYVTMQQRHPVGFDHRIQGERAARLALAPAHEQWCVGQAIAHMATIATAIES